MERLKKALIPYDIPYKKIRVGRKIDGGYPIFNYKLNEITATYSYGINDDVSFELNLTAYISSVIYMYDHTIPSLPQNHPQFYFKKEAGSCENLIKHVTETGNASKNTLFLKMDIEGHEWDIFKNLPIEILSCFQQITIEFHNLEFMQNHCFGFIGMTQDDMAAVFEKINTVFYLGHIHGNNCGGIKEIPNTIEVCYIRKDLLSAAPCVETVHYPLPLIDYPNNVNIPDYILDWWLNTHDSVPLYRFEKKIFSQNGEDGITMKLVEMIYDQHAANYYVEFGVENGCECNTRILREKYGWKGLQMDGGFQNETINLHQEFITKENIVELFKKYDVPPVINLLSIDIDFNDFYCLHQILHNYTCDIIICEFNGTHFPNEDKIVKYDPNGRWDNTNYFGASLLAYYKLGKKYNHTLVYCNYINAFFVRDDIIAAKKLNFINMGDINKLYVPPSYSYGPNGGHPQDPQYRQFVSSEDAFLLL